jgi:UPF0716 family protein affecting phage T7 exclusion
MNIRISPADLLTLVVLVSVGYLVGFWWALGLLLAGNVIYFAWWLLFSEAE